jgi:hypothetical protein
MHKIVFSPSRRYFHKQVVYSDRERGVDAVIKGVNIEVKITADHHQEQ